MDPRLELVFQSLEEAGEDGWRAKYVAAKSRFEVINSGGIGVKEFKLNEDAIPDQGVVEEREVAGELNEGVS